MVKHLRLRWIWVGMAMAGVFLAKTPVRAQDQFGPWNMGFGVGLLRPTGDMENLLQDGFGVNLNFGHQKSDRILGWRMDVLYGSFKLTDNAFGTLNNATDGHYTVFGGGPSLVLTSKRARLLKPSIYAGPGLYYERAEATWEDGCSPVFGCSSGGSDYNTETLNTTKLGWQGGAGLDWLFDNGGGAVTLHVQFLYVPNTQVDLTAIPIILGYKVNF